MLSKGEIGIFNIPFSHFFGLIFVRSATLITKLFNAYLNIKHSLKDITPLFVLFECLKRLYNSQNSPF